jgi:hypothetical protein
VVDPRKYALAGFDLPLAARRGVQLAPAATSYQTAGAATNRRPASMAYVKPFSGLLASIDF